MPVADEGAALYIYSSTHTAAAVTALLGVTPTFSVEKDQPRLSADGTQARGPSTWAEAVWGFRIDPDEARLTAPEDDTAGFASLGELIRRFEDKAQLLGQMRENAKYDTRIWWNGSATGQGGFVLPVEMLTGLAALGCDLFGNLVSADRD